MKNRHSNGVLKFRTPRLPLLQSQRPKLIISLSKEHFHLLSSIVPVTCLIFPNCKSSLLFSLNASSDEEPRFVNCTSFMLVSQHLVILILAPSIENAGLNLVALNHIRYVHILMLELERLENTRVPLMECRFLPVGTNFIANHAESFEFVVAILVKLGIFDELTERAMDHVSLLFRNYLV